MQEYVTYVTICFLKASPSDHPLGTASRSQEPTAQSVSREDAAGQFHRHATRTMAAGTERRHGHNRWIYDSHVLRHNSSASRAPWFDRRVPSGRDGNARPLQRSRRRDRLRLDAGNQELAHRQQVADGQAVCELSGGTAKFDAVGSSDRAGGVFALLVHSLRIERCAGSVV